MASEFEGAGRTVGLEVWRIEKLTPVKLSENIGKFYVGDSYILLSTTKLRSGALSHAIHFWLGSETSIDESGVAAYKSVELDASLGGGPVQYRELQGEESTLFLSYFKSSGGITYLPGGISSGFKAVVRDVYETKLLHLKGKRTVRVSTVPLSAASLNSGDVFILDAGLKIYVFNGPSANKFEKAKGLEVAQSIKNEDRGGRAELVFMDANPTDPGFWTPLGGYRDPATLPGGPDDDSVAISSAKRLFRITDSDGTVAFDEVTPSSGKLTKELLVSSDVFLLQSTSGKIYLWIGKGASLTEKKEATPRALQHIARSGLPSTTKIERVSESFESAAFKSEFLRWDAPISFGINKANNPATTGISSGAVDVKELLSRKIIEDTPIDDGKGSLEIWVINNFKKEPVSPSQYGHFFSGDSYIVLYTYQRGGSSQYIIYYWLGRDSTADEKGAAALLTIALDESLGGKPVQVRVVQGKEPAHFRQLFLGKMIIYEGGFSKGVDGRGVQQEDRALFHVRGTSVLNTVALGVKLATASLNSEDCFVLVTPSEVYAWHGLGSTPNEQAFALSIATTLAGTYKGTSGRLVQVVYEGFESEAFWSELGGKSEYASMSPGENPPKDARLFSASNATGRFKIEEVDQFVQSDLNDEDVFLLDTYTQLFVWMGSRANQHEKEAALEFAARYVSEADDGRDPDIPIVRITAGQEPIIFSCHFPNWDSEYFTKSAFLDPYQAKLKALEAENKDPAAPFSSNLKGLKRSPTKASAAPVDTTTTAAETPSSLPSPAAESQFSAPVAGQYTLEELKAGVPAGVNPVMKEEYLDDAAFAQLFGDDRAAFRALPKWKKDAAKKAVGLF